MFFPACENLANNQNDYKSKIKVIDNVLSGFLPEAIIQPNLIAQSSKVEPDIVLSILRDLAQIGMLQKKQFVQCPHCDTLISDDDYANAMAHDEELQCTSCLEIIDNPENSYTLQYSFSKDTKELLRNKIQSSTKNYPLNKTQLVLLVHGIRTEAEWQGMVKAKMQRDELTHVEPIKYGYFDAIRFWCPLWRKKPIKEVLYKIQHAIFEHKDSEVIIIAHSFGTYAITKIMEENPSIRPARIIYCGSIVKRNFRWDKLARCPKIINDCGSRDIWPIRATFFSWGYGPTGTFGFGFPGIEDRFHDFEHSDYFNETFIDNFWIPWVHDNRLMKSDYVPNCTSVSWKNKLLTVPGMKYFAILLVVIVLCYVYCCVY